MTEQEGIQIDKIILAGGHCKIPLVRSIISGKFPDVPILHTIEPTEVVAVGIVLLTVCSTLLFSGAAYQANLISTRRLIKQTRNIPSLPHAIGLAAANGKFVPLVRKYVLS